MTVGSKVAHSGGSVKYMEAPPILVNGTVMVPMRFVAETFGENVAGMQKTKWLISETNRRKYLQEAVLNPIEHTRSLLMPVTEGANRALCTEE